MKFFSILAIFLLIQPELGFSQNTTNQVIDSDQSIVNFKVGNLRIRKVKGSFSGMSGSLSFNAEDPSGSYFNVCIDAASVDTKSKKRDEHLRTADFFDVETYPNICFESKSISQTAEGYTVQGELSMHGQTREVEFPFTYDGAIFTGTFKVMRLDYGVGEGTGKGMVGDEVEITISCVLER